MNGRFDMVVSKPWWVNTIPSGTDLGRSSDEVKTTWSGIMATPRDMPTARQSLGGDPPRALAGSRTAVTAAELIVLDAAGISNLGESQIACRGGEITHSMSRKLENVNQQSP
jgi:hypothetical protein